VAMLQLPATRVVAFAAKVDTGGGGATAIVNMQAKRAMILAHGMPKPAGKDFELWVIRGDEKIAAGLMRGGAAGQLLVEVDPTLLAQGADALAVTLEPEGGGPAPRGDLVLLAAMPKS
jgi:anti-sigma-K factor RskA